MRRWRCRYPTAFYLALSPEHLDYLIEGNGPGLCRHEKHNHRIMRLWALAHDLELEDA